jgi:hypothetical protein
MSIAAEGAHITKGKPFGISLIRAFEFGCDLNNCYLVLRDGHYDPWALRTGA